MLYEKEVKVLLGEDAYYKFLDAVDEGIVSVQQMTDIAVGLHKVVGGKFKLAQDSRAFEFDRAAARQVLSNWYQYEACEMDGKTALEKFVAILRDKNIGLYPLAHEISLTRTPSIYQSIKEKLTDCGSGKQRLIVIEKLTDENHELKRKVSKLQSELDQTNIDSNYLMTVKENKEYMLCQFQDTLETLDGAMAENKCLKTEKDSLLESDEEETADTLIGKFYKKEFFGHTHAVLKVAQKNSRMLKEAERLRKRLDHLCITKLHHSYLEERSSTRCFVLEPLEIADGTLATVAELRTHNLREYIIWRDLSKLSSALTYLHQQHPTTRPFLAYNLSPHTVIDVYRTDSLRLEAAAARLKHRAIACPA